MNRKKKMNATLKKRNKKEKAKLAPKNKTPYISKAKREEIMLNEIKADDGCALSTKDEIVKSSEE